MTTTSTEYKIPGDSNRIENKTKNYVGTGEFFLISYYLIRK